MVWLPILRNIDADSQQKRKAIKKRDAVFVLEFWTDLRSTASQEFGKRLDQFGAIYQLEKIVIQILKPGTFTLLANPIWLQNIAITAAEWLNSPQTLRCIKLKLESRNRYLAVNACACLVKNKAQGYESALIKTLMRFPEDAPAITSQIGAAGGADVLHVLKPFLGKLPKYALMNFIALVEQSSDPSLLPIVEERLRNTRNNEEICALLRAIGHLGGSEQRATILPYLFYFDDEVKTQAAKSIGRIGEETDIEFITPLLSAQSWWLRYRAAKAIILLCGKNEDYVKELSATLTDPYAIDILRHTWAEQEWHQL